MPAADTPFAYALLRVVPSLQRGERLNVGVAVFCRQLHFLDLRTGIDAPRLAAVGPGIDVDALRASLANIRAVVCGEPSGGALAALPPSERFGWLVAPSSTILQPSAVHTGLTRDPRATLDSLFAALVTSLPL